MGERSRCKQFGGAGRSAVWWEFKNKSGQHSDDETNSQANFHCFSHVQEFVPLCTTLSEYYDRKTHNWILLLWQWVIPHNTQTHKHISIHRNTWRQNEDFVFGFYVEIICVLLDGQWLRSKRQVRWHNVDEPRIWCRLAIFDCSMWPFSFDFFLFKLIRTTNKNSLKFNSH